MEPVKATRYKFDQIFTFDIINKILTPLYNVQINGSIFFKDMPISPETKIDKLNPYENMNKDVAGVWNAETQMMEIVGYY